MKSSDQVKILENEYTKNPYWGKDMIKYLSRNLGLKES